MSYEITNQQRRRILNGFNKLKDAVYMVQETNDLYLSNIRDMDEFQTLLADILKFEPKRNEEGFSQWHSNWVLKANTVIKKGD